MPDNMLNPGEPGSTGAEDSAPADDPKATWIVYTDDDGKSHRVTVAKYRELGL